MNLGKISFFKRIYLSLTDFRMYPYTQKENIVTAIGYFIKLLVVMSVIIGTFVTSNIFEESPMILSMFENSMPDFTISNGTLIASENIEKELNSNTYLVVNSDYNYAQIQNIKIDEADVHNYCVLVLSDVTVVGVKLDDGIYELGSIVYETGMNYTKEQLSNDWRMLNESTTSKFWVWIGISIGVFIVLVIIRLWILIMYMISTYVINIMFGLKLKFVEYLKLVIYISTMPIILETIAIVTVGGISETVNFISILISCVYIFYALRALKLDSLILGGSGKTAEERIKSALSHAQQELEKQLNELEKQEENGQKEINEKKEIEELSKELKEKEENLMKAQKEYQEVLNKAMNLSSEKAKNTEENKMSDDEK